jgi:hypothetical protein
MIMSNYSAVFISTSFKTVAGVCDPGRFDHAGLVEASYSAERPAS